MSTSWSKVFDKFLTLIEDRTLCNLLTDEDMTELLATLLNGGISLYFKNCTKDLTDFTEPEFLRDDFTGDGHTQDFVISKNVALLDSDAVAMYCEVDGIVLVEGVGYTYTDATKTFHLTTAPEVNDEVICGYDYVGEFADDLTDTETWVIAHSMIVIWFSSKLYNVEKMKERLSNKDWNSPHSPANLLAKLIELRKQSIKEIKTLTRNYSYNDFTGFN